MGFWQRDWWIKRKEVCCDCECTWTKAAIWLAILAVTGVVLTLLILAFAVVRPPTASADDALLTRFELAPAPNSTARPPLQLLSYNATVTVSLRNPNLHYGITFGALAAAFSFNGTRFDESGTVPTLDLGARKETTVRLRVGDVGRALPKLPAAGAAEFAKQKEAGVFEVEVRLDTVMQYKGRKTKCPLGVVCPLRLQLVDPDVAATAFQKTKCTILRATPAVTPTRPPAPLFFIRTALIGPAAAPVPRFRPE